MKGFNKFFKVIKSCIYLINIFFKIYLFILVLYFIRQCCNNLSKDKHTNTIKQQSIIVAEKKIDNNTEQVIEYNPNDAYTQCAFDVLESLTELEGDELKQMINQQCQDTLEEVSNESVYHDNKK